TLGPETGDQGRQRGGIAPLQVAAAVGQQAAANLDHRAPPDRQRLFGKRVWLMVGIWHGGSIGRHEKIVLRTIPASGHAKGARKRGPATILDTRTISEDHKRSAAREKTR